MNEMLTRYAFQMPQFDWIRKRDGEGAGMEWGRQISCSLNAQIVMVCFVVVAVCCWLSYAIVAVCS